MPPKQVITIGNFDGVHLGHQTLIRHARAIANRANLPLLAITFNPLPAKILRPDAAPPRLLSIEDRTAALRHAGADNVIVLEPTTSLLNQSPHEFLASLARDYNPHTLVEGYNFCFGKNRQGDTALLKQLGPQLAFATEIVHPVHVVLQDLLTTVVSSSLVRGLLSRGRVADAARCLGRPYKLSGTVVKGNQRGRKIDAPTANLHLPPNHDLLIPTDAVYAATVNLPNDPNPWPAAVSIGNQPTFNQSPQPVIEAHLLNFSGDLYSQTIDVHLLRWLRDQQPFPTVDDLKTQIHRDLNHIRRLHAAGLLTPPPLPTTITPAISLPRTPA